MRSRIGVVSSVVLLLAVLLPAQALGVHGVAPTEMGPLGVYTNATTAAARLGVANIESVAAPAVGFSPATLPPLGSISLNCASPEIPIEHGGIYYWVGDYLHIDGLVYNNSAYALNYPKIYLKVKTSGGVKIAEYTGSVSAHVVDPKEYATFKVALYLPEQAGSEPYVIGNAWGLQETLPTPVSLTLVSQTVTDTAGQRTYTCVYRNDSDVTVHTPVLGGEEVDAEDNLIDTLLDWEDVAIAPGETWVAEPVGYHPSISVAEVNFYCEAIPEVTDTPVFRFRNLRNGFYLWTADMTERNTIVRTLPDTWRLEGQAYRVTIANNSAPLWRFLNISGGYYLYTSDPAEKAHIKSTLSDVWRYEGPAYNVSMDSGGSPVWRFRNLGDGTYLYSADPSEKESIVSTLKSTWLLEGKAYFLSP